MMAEPAVVERYLGDGYLGALLLASSLMAGGMWQGPSRAPGQAVALLTSSSMLPLPSPSGRLDTHFPMLDTFGRSPMLPPCFLSATFLVRPPVSTPGPPPRALTEASDFYLCRRLLLLLRLAYVAMSVSLAP